MITRLVITDLTRMYRGRVCIAGYDKNHRCIRPTLQPPGIPERDLAQNGQPIIFPFALVEFFLIKPIPQPPHTEDWYFAPNSPLFIQKIEDRKAVLNWSLFDSVGAIFEQPIQDDLGFYVMDCQGPRSIGAIRPREIIQVIYEKGLEEGAWDYRIAFVDGQGKRYRLKITDLTWHYCCDSLRGENRTPTQISAELTDRLTSSEVFLRIGLARGWKKFPDRCYLQVNGIHTFPDYLEGKTFADFAPR